jgi:hypothetical protein
MRARAAIALFTLACGCAGPAPRTQVMLEIDAEPDLAAEVVALDIQILGGEAGRPTTTYASRYVETITDELVWPWRVALVPFELDPPRAWLAELTARRADGSVVTASTVRGGDDADRTVLVRVVLEDACLDVECEEERCQDGRCVDPRVDVLAAPDFDSTE